MKKSYRRKYRHFQAVSLLLETRLISLIFYTFTLYTSAFFLFNQEENFHNFVFDYKVHGIIFCSIFSIAAGGLINQFYDQEKDLLTRPFRTRLQAFIKQKYILYSYIGLNLFSLSFALILSPRIFFFFLIYQFFIWFYSHKLSKWLLFNNLTYVGLSLYPFFGLLVYYQHFSWKLFWMASYLFLIIFNIDILKDYISQKADRLFGYHTLPIYLKKKTKIIVSFLLLTNATIAFIIARNLSSYSLLLSSYFYSSIPLFLLSILIFLRLPKSKLKYLYLINGFKLWIFIGVITMLLSGIFETIQS